MARQVEARPDAPDAEPDPRDVDETGVGADVDGGPSRPLGPLAARVAYWLGWLLPFLVGARYIGLETLDVRRGQDMLIGDWTTYISSPNFLRDAPFFSFPIGRIPDYIAPVGTTLGQTDSMPIFTPVYRILLWMFPGQPIQLLGPLLFVSFFAMFGILRYSFRGVLRRRYGPLTWVAELAAIACAGALLAQPFFLNRLGHATLMHQWVIVLALVFALEEVARDRLTALPYRAVVPVVAAAIVNPYFLAMVLPISIAPVLRRGDGPLIAWVQRLAVRVAGLVLISGAISVVLGYIGGGGRAENQGFGLYPSNLLFLFDPGNTSRLFGDLQYQGSAEGYGYVGFGVLVVIAIVLVRRTRERASRPARIGSAWSVVLVCAALAFYAMLPVVWFANTMVMDANPLMSHLSLVANTLRTNGRFIWPLIWLVGLATFGFVLRRFDVRVALAVGTLCFATQLIEEIPSIHSVDNPNYDVVESVLRRAEGSGAVRVEVQPPFITYECQSTEDWPTFDSLRNVVMASAVLELPINSGYAGRGDDRWQTSICQREVQAFEDQRYAPDVLYVLPAARYTDDLGLRCVPLPDAQVACMDERVTTWG